MSDKQPFDGLIGPAEFTPIISALQTPRRGCRIRAGIPRFIATIDGCNKGKGETP
ncbi:hypothetical protein [Cupriavidus necator]|jgi:hypothetical protein